MQALIDSLGLDKAGFARKLRMKEGTIGRWCLGQQKPRKSNIEVIADKFQYPLVRLVIHLLEDGSRPDRQLAADMVPVPALQHHPCPILTRFMTHCYQRKEVVADALMTAMDDYVDRYGGTETVGESEGRIRQDGARGALPKT